MSRGGPGVRQIVQASLLVLLGSLAGLALPANAIAGTKLVVPEDASLPLSEYAARGVPDWRVPWTPGELDRALAALERLPRPQLPRAGGASRPLFDRLLHGSDEDLPGHPHPDLIALYGTHHGDGLLFDRELVAIQGQALAAWLDEVEWEKRELDGMSRGLTEQREAALRAHSNSKLMLDAALQQAGFLVMLSAIPEAHDTARTLMLERASQLLPALAVLLAPEDLDSLVALLRAFAEMEVNVSIRSGLRGLAARLEAAGAADSPSGPTHEAPHPPGG